MHFYAHCNWNFYFVIIINHVKQIHFNIKCIIIQVIHKWRVKANYEFCLAKKPVLITEYISLIHFCAKANKDPQEGAPERWAHTISLMLKINVSAQTFSLCHFLSTATPGNHFVSTGIKMIYGRAKGLPEALYLIPGTTWFPSTK